MRWRVFVPDAAIAERQIERAFESGDALGTAFLVALADWAKLGLTQAGVA
jgi:hypothetical protein